MGDLSVLELAMGLDVGGAETHVVGLCRSLSAQGWTVEVASGGGRRVQDLDATGVPHHLVPLASRNPFQMMKAYRLLKNLARERHFDLLHAHARIPAWIGSFVAKEAGVPLVTTYHWTFVSGILWNSVTRAGDWTIAVSDDIKDYVVREFGFSADRVTVIPNGIDCEEFSPVTPAEEIKIRQRFGLDESLGPVIVYASRMTKELSATAIATVEAVSLLNDYPKACLIVAGDGEYLEDVRKAAATVSAREGHQVRCLGFVTDMASLYRASDLVIGMSRVALEAMACGKPSIVAGPDGDYGLVNPSNVEVLELRNFTSRDAPRPTEPAVLANEIRDCLNGMLDKSGDSAAVCGFGLDYVRQRHSVETTTAAVEEVYRKLLERG